MINENSNKEKQGKIILIGGVVFLLFAFIFFGIFFLKEKNVPTHLFIETISSSSVKLSWSGEEETTQYNIYRSDNPEGPYKKRGFSETEEYIDENLKPNTTYYYKVSQVINFKESEKTPRAGVVTNIEKPSGLKAEAVNFQEKLDLRVVLTWDYVPGAEKYTVYRTMEKEGVYKRIGNTDTEKFTDTEVAPETTYYYAITQTGKGKESAYSKEVSATTPSLWACGDKISYGGKGYKTVKIGEQCWFQENINIQGESIDERECDIKKRCYEENEAMCNIYGGLYNFESITCGRTFEGTQGVCPLGWRIPTEDDWVKLETEMGMKEDETEIYGFRGTDEGSKLAGRYDLWKTGALKAGNNFGFSGFDALPGGQQPSFTMQVFRGIGEVSAFWSSSRANEDEECKIWEPAYTVREIYYTDQRIKKTCYSQNGTASLRCVRDYKK